MVKKWEKYLKKLILNHKSTDFEALVNDILSGDYKKYDIIRMKGFPNRFRIREGSYRIVFEVVQNKEINIISIGPRGNVYKRLGK